MEKLSKNDQAKASLKNSELIQRFKEVDTLPEEEQSVLYKNHLDLCQGLQDQTSLCRINCKRL